MFGSLVENDAYKQAEKDWFVQLSQSDMYWYDLNDFNKEMED